MPHMYKHTGPVCQNLGLGGGRWRLFELYLARHRPFLKGGGPVLLMSVLLEPWGPGPGATGLLPGDLGPGPGGQGLGPAARGLGPKALGPGPGPGARSLGPGGE